MEKGRDALQVGRSLINSEYKFSTYRESCANASTRVERGKICGDRNFQRGKGEAWALKGGLRRMHSMAFSKKNGGRGSYEEEVRAKERETLPPQKKKNERSHRRSLTRKRERKTVKSALRRRGRQG